LGAELIEAGIERVIAYDPARGFRLPPITGPEHLSETGLYADFATRTLADGVLAYAPRYPLWSDGSEKVRYLALPPNTKIDTSNMDVWSFPVGTKAWKEFRVGGKLIETRMVWKARENGWWMVSYVWAADGSEAHATPGGVKNAWGTTHDVPTQQQCANCHDQGVDGLVGVSALQLSSGGQGLLSKLAALGRLTVDPGREFEVPGAGVTKDALGYLHGNCSHCHNDGSHLEYQSALRLDVRVTDTDPDKTHAATTPRGLVMRHFLPPDVPLALVPGDPAHSGLLARMQHRGDGWEMPNLGTKVVDPAGVAAVTSWIAALK
jgi:hypothetical protein